VTARRVFLALLAVLAGLDAAILAIRINDILTLGHLRPIAGEGPVLYSIWKLRHGYPLYEWPTRPYFALTLYNFLFYDVYAAVFTALRVPSDAMLVAGRFLTLGFGAAGAFAQYAAGRQFAPRPATGSGRPTAWQGAGSRLALALLSFVTWFGCVLPGVWSIGVRPDIAGLALATAGIAIALPALQDDRPRRLILASVMFLLAWSFKQSMIALFAATCVYVLVWRRSFTALACLVVPLVAGVAAAMAIGGSVYRANVIDAPSINAWIPYLALYWYRGVALPDLLLWGMALAAVVSLARPGSRHGPLGSIAGAADRSRRAVGADLTYPALAVTIAFATGTMAMMKVGSGINHLLELNVACSLTAAALLGSAWETSRARAACTAGALMLVPMIAFAVTLLQDSQGRLWTALQLKSQGVALHLTTPDDARSRAQLALVVASLPKPVYIDDDLFALPWHSTGDRYPAVVLDPVFYLEAMHRGLAGRGVPGLFEDKYFGSAVLTDQSSNVTAALRSGYRLERSIPRPDDQTLRVMVRLP
jgi:hypothetical protein